MVLALAVHLWQYRYGLRIYSRSHQPHDWAGGSYFWWCIDDCAVAGWQWAVDDCGGVKAALATDPVEEADNELMEWTE